MRKACGPTLGRALACSVFCSSSFSFPARPSSQTGKPPESNTGVVITLEVAMEGIFKTLKNGLTVSVDWLTFTLFDVSTVQEVISFLGYNVSDFSNCEHGARGYKKMLKCSDCNLYILYDGNDDMGIHVQITGSSISTVINHFKTTLEIDTPFGTGYDIDFESTFLRELLKSIRNLGGKISRLDLAVDDVGCQFFTVDEVADLHYKNRVVTKTRTFEMIKSDRDMKNTGSTVYFGNRKSDIMLRVYDKQLEQKGKLQTALNGAEIPPWVRWELELKSDRAISAVDSIISGMDLGEVVVGILSHYIRFIELNNSNRSRCSIMNKWQSFIDGIKPLKLSFPAREKTMADKENWIDKQCAPTIYAILIHHGGDMESLYRILDSGRSRMKKSLYDLAVSSAPQ